VNYQAVYDKIIVEKIEENGESKTNTGIILQTSQVVFGKGKVVSMGDGTYQNAQRVEMDFSIGDIVLYNPNVAYPLNGGLDNKYFVMSDKDVVAIEKGETNVN